MSLMESPPRNPGDDVEELLRAFFRSQMPHPWPAPRTLPFRTAPRPASSTRSLIRSRLALAASVALLMLGSLLLPGRFTANSQSGANLAGPMTSDTHLRQQMRKEQPFQERDHKNKPGLGADDGDFENGLGPLDLPPLR